MDQYPTPPWANSTPTGRNGETGHTIDESTNNNGMETFLQEPNGLFSSLEENPAPDALLPAPGAYPDANFQFQSHVGMGDMGDMAMQDFDQLLMLQRQVPTAFSSGMSPALPDMPSVPDADAMLQDVSPTIPQSTPSSSTLDFSTPQEEDLLAMVQVPVLLQYDEFLSDMSGQNEDSVMHDIFGLSEQYALEPENRNIITTGIGQPIIQGQDMPLGEDNVATTDPDEGDTSPEKSPYEEDHSPSRQEPLESTVCPLRNTSDSLEQKLNEMVEALHIEYEASACKRPAESAADKQTIFTCPIGIRYPILLDPSCWAKFPRIGEVKRHLRSKHHDLQNCLNCQFRVRNTNTFATNMQRCLDQPIETGESNKATNIYKAAPKSSLVFTFAEEKCVLIRSHEIVHIDPREQWEHIYKILHPGEDSCPSPYTNEQIRKWMNHFLWFMRREDHCRLFDIWQSMPDELKAIHPDPKSLWEMAFTMWLPQAFKKHAPPEAKEFGDILLPLCSIPHQPSHKSAHPATERVGSVSSSTEHLSGQHTTAIPTPELQQMSDTSTPSDRIPTPLSDEDSENLLKICEGVTGPYMPDFNNFMEPVQEHTPGLNIGLSLDVPIGDGTTDTWS